jgi:hypothetical protein
MVFFLRNRNWILCSYVVFFILQPLPETVALVEDIVVEYVTDLVSLFCVSMILSFVLYLLSCYAY